MKSKFHDALKLDEVLRNCIPEIVWWKYSLSLLFGFVVITFIVFQFCKTVCSLYQKLCNYEVKVKRNQFSLLTHTNASYFHNCLFVQTAWQVVKGWWCTKQSILFKQENNFFLLYKIVKSIWNLIFLFLIAIKNYYDVLYFYKRKILENENKLWIIQILILT